MDGEVARRLVAEAESVNERRVLVLHGRREATLAAARDALDATSLDLANATLVSDRDALPMERVSPRRTEELLGTTRNAVVYDAHAECRPNAIGRVTGAVDGGGLLVFCTPPLADWPARRDDFDAGLAVPPFDVDDVTGHFRTRLVATLRAHPGVAVVDVDAESVEADGLTNPAPRSAPPAPEPPTDHDFPAAAYDACLTADQADAVARGERLRIPDTALVLEADRGRGKSSAVGLAAACLARDGDDVLVTAPRFRNAAEVFARARELLAELDCLATDDDNRLTTDAGGRLRYASPPAAADLPDDPDVVVADEAAALPVRILDDLLACDRVAFATTVHGYEGAGRGFDVRFRDHLADARHDVVDVTLTDPIRYAAGDPVEVWSFHALCLAASPAVDPLLAAARPDTTTYDALEPTDLLADENLLRETFGLLVYAHYRTEPNDLARLLDAPNLAVRALTHDGHVAAVALLAREGGLDADTRRAMYEGGRVKGNMLPDVLTSQLRDEDAARPVGYRVMRIATHPVCRSRGLGSALLAAVRDEFGDDADWLGVGFGATPDLVDFWRQNGYGTLHVSTTRNDTSGEYSAIMLDPTSDAGRALHDRHADWFARRAPSVLGDALRDLDADVARACLRACDATPDPALSADDWRLVAACSYGPAMYAVDPGPFRDLACHHLVAGDPGLLDPVQERLLVRKALQHRPWREIVDELDFHSHGQAMRAFGDAFRLLVDAYGTDAAHEEATRHQD